MGGCWTRFWLPAVGLIPRCASTIELSSSSASGVLGVDVLETYLTAGDELVVSGPADLDLPQLLGAALVDRLRLNL